MADEKPGSEDASGEEYAREESQAEAMENFGPVTSLEPDGLGPVEDGPGGGAIRERLYISVTWETISKAMEEMAPGAPEGGTARAAGPGAKSAGTRKKPGRPGRARSQGKSAEPAKPAGKAGGKNREADTENPEAVPQPAAKKGVDWSQAPPVEKAALPADSEEESETDALLLDDAFLRRTFKDVHFPASKELVLRYVDQEQDFIYGQDRTVNLHNLITHLGDDTFAERRDLIRAIKDRLQFHHHHQ